MFWALGPAPSHLPLPVTSAGGRVVKCTDSRGAAWVGVPLASRGTLNKLHKALFLSLQWERR